MRSPAHCVVLGVAQNCIKYLKIAPCRSRALAFKMVDEEDNLTDAQLRAQLKIYGVNPGPILPTTKPLLLKKLKALKKGGVENQEFASKAKKRRSVASSTPTRHKAKLSGFSSGEEDFLGTADKAVDSPSGKSRRRSALPKAGYINKSKGGENNIPSSSLLYNHDDDETDEKGPSLGLTTTTSTRRRSSARPSKSLQSFSTDSTAAPSAAPQFIADEHSHKIRTNFRKNSFEIGEDEGEPNVAVGKKTPKRPAHSSDTNISYQKKPLTPANGAEKSNNADETDSTIPKTSSEENNEIEEEELEVAFGQSSDFFSNLKGSLFIVLVVVLLICLAGSYISLFNNGISYFPKVLKADQALPKADQEKAFNVLQCLHRHLSQNAGLKECGYPDVSDSVNGKEIPTLIHSCFSSFKEKLQNFKKMSVVIVQMAMKEEFNEFFRIEDGRFNKAVPVSIETLPKITLASIVIDKPFTCRLKQAFQRLSKYVLIVLIGLVIALLTYFLLKKRWMMDDEDTRLMFVFVERIIETLRSHCEVCKHDKELPAYLPIPHVRDMLIPPRERNAKLRAWNKAVEFLSSTDSRIRVETQRIAGEDFEVWRWIGVMTSDPKNKGAKNHLGPEEESGKFWQGPAFDKLDKVVRLPIITPTPCLKIRYLHGGPAEKEDGWDRRVGDALLEKCIADGANILHIYVDTKSPEGCVYVKCDSLDSAGDAFRSIYGNWFDGRLVIVKFVTLTRYHQRFPESRTSTQPLQSSGEFPSSLGWHSSADGVEQKKNN